MSEPTAEQVARRLEIIHARVEGLLKRTSEALQPIYREGDRGEPFLVGSGVLLGVGSNVVLASAAHVIDESRTRRLYFGLQDVMRPVPAFRNTSPLPSSGLRDEDRIDVGFWLLPPDMVRELPSNSWIRLSDLDILGRVPALASGYDRFVVFGFPHSRQPRMLKTPHHDVAVMRFLTGSCSKEAYENAGLNIADTLFVEYDKETTFAGGIQQTGPNLQGVSGGSLWFFPGVLGDPGRPQLAGIVTTWRIREPLGILATRVRVLVQAIASNLAEAREAIQVAETQARDAA